MSAPCGYSFFENMVVYIQPPFIKTLLQNWYLIVVDTMWSWRVSNPRPNIFTKQINELNNTLYKIPLKLLNLSTHFVFYWDFTEASIIALTFAKRGFNLFILLIPELSELLKELNYCIKFGSIFFFGMFNTPFH